MANAWELLRKFEGGGGSSRNWTGGERLVPAVL